MKTLLVLGSGMQGVAATYDAARFGPFKRIVLGDLDIVRAIDGAQRVNTLLGREICEPARFDAANSKALSQVLAEHPLAICALPYQMPADVEEEALNVGCSVVDMGLDPEPALRIHARASEAVAKGISIVTDCGLAPGLVNVFAADLIAKNPGATHVRSYCGGLPEQPVGPLGYVLRFSMDSVIGEYSDEILALRSGEAVTGEPLAQMEEIVFDGVGRLEAFTTSGGTGTAPYSFRSRVSNYEYKTLRYPGHVAAMKLFRDCGFWSEEVNSHLGIAPRTAFSAVMDRTLRNPAIKDMVLVRVESDSPTGTLRLEMLERQDPVTGFTAMERLTGFSTSIIALAIASGKVAPGCCGCEEAISPELFRIELERRGFAIRQTQVS